MPWTVVDEPFSAAPRSVGPLISPGDSTVVDVEERWGTIRDANLRGTVDVTGCERLDVSGSSLRGVSLLATPDLEIEVSRCEFVECDLSALRITSISSTRVEGCKLSGVDFGSGFLRDVEFVRTVIRLSTLRMAEMERVAMRDCTLDDVDFYESRLTDVSFPGSELRSVEFDKATFRNVDLREAAELDLRSCRRFDGCLLTSSQIAPLAFLFAHAAGAMIEQDPENGEM